MALVVALHSESLRSQKLLPSSRSARRRLLRGRRYKR
jgi:hypothetical protein